MDKKKKIYDLNGKTFDNQTDYRQALKKSEFSRTYVPWDIFDDFELNNYFSIPDISRTPPKNWKFREDYKQIVDDLSSTLNRIPRAIEARLDKMLQPMSEIQREEIKMKYDVKRYTYIESGSPNISDEDLEDLWDWEFIEVKELK